MIISDNEAVARLTSPGNLINKIKSAGSRNSAMNLFGINRNNVNSNPLASQEIKAASTAVILDEKETIEQEEIKPFFNPFNDKRDFLVLTKQEDKLPSTEQNPSVSNLLADSETQIKLGLAHDTALSLLTDSVAMMKIKLDDIKPDKLPAVISAASKVVEGIRRERNEASKNSKGQDVHYHFYTPVSKKISDFEVIEVS